MDGLMRCGCPCCDSGIMQNDQHPCCGTTQDKEEESVPVLPAHVGLTGVAARANGALLLRDYSNWTWEG